VTGKQPVEPLYCCKMYKMCLSLWQRTCMRFC